MSVSHMQLNARIDRRDHECLGDGSLRVRRRGYEPGDQQGGHNSKMAHGFPLQAVIVLASAIAICRRARATLATPSLLRRGGRSDSNTPYNSVFRLSLLFSAPRAASVELYFLRPLRASSWAGHTTVATSGLPCCRHGLKAFKRLLFSALR